MSNQQATISHLIHLPESANLDFKEVFHANTLDLIHDILCMSNSLTSGTRTIVFGVSDKEREITGIQDDPNRKSQAQIYDLLRQSHLNHIPEIRLDFTQIDEKEIGLLTIADNPHKPYFLLRDKAHGRQTIRAGVIYTRLGDSNTPLKETTPERMVETMWRQRLGLDLAPLERFLVYLDQPEDWIETPVSELCYYHRLFPEFTIYTNREREPFSEVWNERGKFPDPHAYKYLYELRYHSTAIDYFYLIACDGGRYSIPMPEITMPKNSDDIYADDYESQFHIHKASIRYKVAKLMSQYRDESLDSVLTRCLIQVI